MKRGKVISFVIILILASLMNVGNVEAKETEKIICELQSPIHGIDASFGFVMEYNPSESRIIENQNFELENLLISYSPSPEPVTININLAVLLESYNINVPSILNGWPLYIDSWDDLPSELKDFKLPIEDTPLGSYTVKSIVIYSFTIVDLVLDININGQINATAETTDGAFGDDYRSSYSFIWTEWGAKELIFHPFNFVDQAKVTSNFKYWPTLQLVLKLKSDFTPIDDINPFFNESISLGEIPFNTPVISTITIEKPYTKISDLESEINTLQSENSRMSSDLEDSKTEVTGLNTIIN